MTGIACVIPAYNAASTLAAVARGLRASLPGVLLIAVDDGSSDPTHAVALASCDRVVRHAANRGKGAALRAGFAVALNEHVWAVATVDADGQHDPAHAPDLLDAQMPAIRKLKSLADPSPKPEPAVLVSLGMAGVVALFFLVGILAGLTSVGYHLIEGR